MNNGIEKILNTKIKYSILDKEINIINNKSNVINIYIDLLDIYKKLFKYSAYDKDEFKEISHYQIASLIINTAAHYRNYFYTRKKLFSNIYMYYSFDKCDLVHSISSYKNKIYSKYNDDLYSDILDKIKESLKLVKTFSEYIPHYSVIDTHTIDSSMIPYILIKESNIENDTNIIITNNLITYQTLLKFSNTYALSVRYRNSKFISSNNILKEYTKTKLKDEDYSIFNFFYEYILALSGYDVYSIERVYTFTFFKALKTFRKLYNNNKISLKYISKDDITNILINEGYLNLAQLRKFNLNYQILSLSNVYLKINDANKLKIYNQIKIERRDAQALKTLNNTYFYSDPIEIFLLLKGEEY